VCLDTSIIRNFNFMKVSFILGVVLVLIGVVRIKNKNPTEGKILLFIGLLFLLFYAFAETNFLTEFIVAFKEGLDAH
jgi:hypothetical protein